jgi:DNA-binding transcriptional LysR family regulator
MKQFKWKDVDLNLLVALQALYQNQSVSHAAEQCYVSQSAMSHTLQRLRLLFDDPLFRRVGIRMEPTQRAHDIAPIVDGLLHAIRNDLLTQTSFSVEAYQDVWKIGLTDYAEQLFAPALYDAIKRSSPLSQVSFYNVNRSNYKQVAEQEQIDVLIGSIDNPDQLFVAEKLYSEEHLCLFDPKALPFSEVISLEQFTSVEHALVSPDGNLQTRVDSELAKRGYQRRVTVASRNFLTVRRLLLGRELLCIVPKRFAETEMYSHSLMALQPPIPVAGFDISCLCLKAQQHEAKNRWLRKLVRQIIVDDVAEE